MRMNTYVVEDNPGLQEKAEQFIEARKTCEQASEAAKESEFNRTGVEMSRAYMALAQALELGAGFFPTDDRSHTSTMSVRSLRGEVVIRVPERVDLGHVSGLTAIRPENYISMVEHANAASRAVAAAAAIDAAADAAGGLSRRPR